MLRAVRIYVLNGLMRWFSSTICVYNARMSSRKRSRYPRIPVRLLSRRNRRALTIIVGIVLAVVVVGQRSGCVQGPSARPTAPSSARTDSSDRLRYHHKTFTVVKVVDGDTLDIDVGDGDKGVTRVRLWGVDTPETKHPRTGVMYWGPQASEFARNMVLHKKVMIALEPTRSSRGKYGRLLAYVYVMETDGSGVPEVMLNEQLIAEGYGYADERFDHVLKERFERLQQEAQAQKRGLWKGVRADQWPEWYRRRHDETYQEQGR